MSISLVEQLLQENTELKLNLFKAKINSAKNKRDLNLVSDEIDAEFNKSNTIEMSADRKRMATNVAVGTGLGVLGGAPVIGAAAGLLVHAAGSTKENSSKLHPQYLYRLELTKLKNLIELKRNKLKV
jgi:hypothetical protein